MFNTTLNSYSSNDATVILVESTIMKAIVYNIVAHSNTSIIGVKLTPYSSSRRMAIGAENESFYRNLGEIPQDVMIAVTVSMRTPSSNVNSELLAMNQSVNTGILQRSLRRTSKQSSLAALSWVRICRSNSPTVCMAESWVDPNRGQRGVPRAQVQLDQCSMSTSKWDAIYERQGINRRHACRILINCFV